jgi:hypothetical protein
LIDAVGTGYVVVSDSNCVTICCAFATPLAAVSPAEAEVLAEAAGLVAELVELELLELQAASRAAAVSAAPGVSQRFQLCVIAFGSSIPPLTANA